MKHHAFARPGPALACVCAALAVCTACAAGPSSTAASLPAETSVPPARTQAKSKAAAGTSLPDELPLLPGLSYTLPAEVAALHREINRSDPETGSRTFAYVFSDDAGLVMGATSASDPNAGDVFSIMQAPAPGFTRVETTIGGQPAVRDSGVLENTGQTYDDLVYFEVGEWQYIIRYWTGLPQEMPGFEVYETLLEEIEIVPER